PFSLSNTTTTEPYTLSLHDALPIIVAGHTDSTGSDQHNLQLSQRRAQSVASYLTSQGINSQRLITVGAGKAYPVASNSTEQGRADRKSTRLNSSHVKISYAVFCLKK